MYIPTQCIPPPPPGTLCGRPQGPWQRPQTHRPYGKISIPHPPRPCLQAVPQALIVQSVLPPGPKVCGRSPPLGPNGRGASCGCLKAPCSSKRGAIGTERFSTTAAHERRLIMAFNARQCPSGPNPRRSEGLSRDGYNKA